VQAADVYHKPSATLNITLLTKDLKITLALFISQIMTWWHKHFVTLQWLYY